jgi:hypothetical protein
MQSSYLPGWPLQKAVHPASVATKRRALCELGDPPSDLHRDFARRKLCSRWTMIFDELTEISPGRPV